MAATCRHAGAFQYRPKRGGVENETGSEQTAFIYQMMPIRRTIGITGYPKIFVGVRNLF